MAGRLRAREVGVSQQPGRRRGGYAQKAVAARERQDNACSCKGPQDKIQLTINLEGLNRLIGELSVSQYFREEHEKNDEVEMEITQTVNGDGQLSLEMPIQTKKVDGHCRIVHPFGGDAPKQDSIIRAIRRAQLWDEMLCGGKARNVAELSKKVGFKEGYVRQLLTLNNLAPDIVSAILAGNEPDGLSLARLRRGFPDNWAEQRRALGFE